MIVKNKNNQTKRSIAVNEVSVLRQSRQAASHLLNKVRQIIKKLVSDGVLVSTQQVALLIISLFVDVVSLHSKKLSISPISHTDQEDGRVKLLMIKQKLYEFKFIKKTHKCSSDNLEVRNAKSISVKTNNKIKFNLLYDKNRILKKSLIIKNY